MQALLLPPLNLFLLALVGWIVARWRKRLGQGLMGGAFALLVLLSTPFVAATLLRSLQRYPALDADELTRDDVGAIVILGADASSFAPEYPDHSIGPMTLERLRYGASLHRRTGVPMLVAGGQLRGHLPALAESMAGILTNEFGLQAHWVESGSTSTFENAARTAELLLPLGIDRVYLVTHAWHMPRALRTFEKQGLEVVPAPTAFRVRPRPELGDFLPSASGLSQSSFALHEWLGALWYALRGRS